MKHKLVTLLFAVLCGTANIYAQTPTIIPDKPEVILVSGGTFNMGSNNGGDDGKPVHSVTLSSYSIGKYPVTVGQYKKFCSATDRKMPKTPLWGWNDKHPMVMVNYDDAVSYCNWFGETYGGDWRLPTEAEWEYAARGGNKSSSYEYSGSNDIDRVGWYAGNAGGQTQSVGKKTPNELGIYDMSGNVWEWCKDWYGPYTSAAQTNPKGAASGSYRVLRGGGWFFASTRCRVAHRDYSGPGYRLDCYGFRVVLSQ